MHKQLHQQSGVGMIEVLITVIILSVGLLGVAATQSVAVKETGSSSQRTAAIFLINDLVERMHANPGQFATYKSNIGNCGAAPAQCGSSNCSNQQLAAFDAWEVSCKADDSVRSGNVYYLAEPNFEITCISGDCSNTDGKTGTMQIKVTWKETENKRKQGDYNTGEITLKAAM